ncbi:MAG: Hsp20 family protein [Acidobacteriaceae bacterium]
MSTSLAVTADAENATIPVIPQKNDPCEDLLALTEKIRQRAFQLFQNRGAQEGSDLEDWFKAEAELLRQVPIELRESRQWYTVRAEVPGFESSHLIVWVAHNAICIHGDKQQQSEAQPPQKRDLETPSVTSSAPEFFRRIDLPLAIDPSSVSTHLHDGVLDIDIRKAIPAKRTPAIAA